MFVLQMNKKFFVVLKLQFYFKVNEIEHNDVLQLIILRSFFMVVVFKVMVYFGVALYLIKTEITAAACRLTQHESACCNWKKSNR